MRLVTRIWLAAACVALVATACSSGADVDANVNGDVDADAGDVGFESGGPCTPDNLPDSWPSQLPLPPGCTVAHQLALGASMSLWGAVPDGTNVYTFYDGELASGGWNVSINQNLSDAESGVSGRLAAEGFGHRVMIFIGQAGSASPGAFGGEFDFLVTVVPAE